MSETAQILVRHGVDLKTFREEIMPRALPVVLKSLVAGWPAVQAARQSPRALADLIRGFDQGRELIVIESPPANQGHLFYRSAKRASEVRGILAAAFNKPPVS